MRILLVEDNPGDILLVRQIIRKCKQQVDLSVVTTGVEAGQYLQREGKYKDAILPDLIFLDLNLPQKGGKEVLRDIKANPALRHIPVIIFTSSEAQRDIMDSYQLHANAYLAKPMRIDDFNRIGEAIDRFWFSTAKLPDVSEAGGS